VPKDGRFHVVLNGNVVFSTDSKKGTLGEYRVMGDRLVPPKGCGLDVRRILEREAAERQAIGFLAEGRRNKRARR
jgi:hypothetical protein